MNDNGAIRFTIPAVPVPQPRQRHRVVQSGGRTFTANYTPTKDPVNAFKATARLAAEQAYQGPPLTGPLIVSLVFVFPRGGKPAWLTKKQYPQWFARWKRGGRVPHASARCDRDNLMKSLQDALEGILWKNDGLIFAGTIEKYIASDSEQPHVRVEVKLKEA